MESSIHRAVFLFVSVAATFGGIYWDARAVPNPATRATLLFALSQVEWFLALFLLSLVGNQNVHVGYIRALEAQINTLAGRPVSLWDSIATRRYLMGYKSAFFWLQILIVLVLALLFGFMVVVATAELKLANLYWVGAFEALAVVVLGNWTLRQIDVIQRYLMSAFQSDS